MAFECWCMTNCAGTWRDVAAARGTEEPEVVAVAETLNVGSRGGERDDKGEDGGGV